MSIVIDQSEKHFTGLTYAQQVYIAFCVIFNNKEYDNICTFTTDPKNKVYISSLDYYRKSLFGRLADIDCKYVFQDRLDDKKCWNISETEPDK